MRNLPGGIIVALVGWLTIELLFTGCASPSEAGRPVPSKSQTRPRFDGPSLRQELLRMMKAEQDVRARVFVPGTGEVDPAVVPRMLEIDAANRAKLKEIISLYGWPRSEWAGKDGVYAAFLIVQHAELDWQLQMLRLIEESVHRGDLEPKNLALLTDRLLSRQGKPQIYGTQLKVVNGQVVFDPIEDLDHVDVRRAELGLPPLDEYKRLVEQQLGLAGDAHQPPR